jgi:hypothetical protein
MVQEASPEAETISSMERVRRWRFHICTTAASPNAPKGENPGTSQGCILERRHNGYHPPSPPPPCTRPPAPENHESRRNGYGDLFP